MPLYEYQCDQCGRRFERIQKFSDAPVAECSACGGSVTRLISSPAIQFKGSGWYITDYARKGNGAGGSSGKSESNGSSSDSKPAPASESKATAKSESA